MKWTPSANQERRIRPGLASTPPHAGIAESGYPGTVGWKTGFRAVKDKVFSVTAAPGLPAATGALDNYCDVPGYLCNRRFDEVRKDIFHYAFFAHHLGIAEENEPFNPPDSTTVNPKFVKPVTNTGVGDFPGGDVLITLGAFLDIDGVTPTATSFVQGSTLMHELGHNLKLRHGGGPDEPNCKPPYLSVMNYEYQVRGLLDNVGIRTWGLRARRRSPSTASRRTTSPMARRARSRIGSVGTRRSSAVISIPLRLLRLRVRARSRRNGSRRPRSGIATGYPSRPTR
jgi:hypothetical protein